MPLMNSIGHSLTATTLDGQKLPLAQGALLNTYGPRFNKIAKAHLDGWLLGAMKEPLEVSFEDLVVKRLEEMLQNGPGSPPYKEIDDHTRLSRRTQLEEQVNAVLETSEQILRSVNPGLDQRIYALAEFLYYNMDHTSDENGFLPLTDSSTRQTSPSLAHTSLTTNCGTIYVTGRGTTMKDKTQAYNWNSLVPSNPKEG